ARHAALYRSPLAGERRAYPVSPQLSHRGVGDGIGTRNLARRSGARSEYDSPAPALLDGRGDNPTRPGACPRPTGLDGRPVWALALRGDARPAVLYPRNAQSACRTPAPVAAIRRRYERVARS